MRLDTGKLFYKLGYDKFLLELELIWIFGNIIILVL